MPRIVMLESRVTFLPQLRGMLAGARSPRLDQAYSGRSEVFEPISSTKTRRPASIPSATKALQAALSNSSRSVAPTYLFSAPTHAPQHPADRGVAHRNPRHPRQELAPLGERRSRPLLEVRFQQLPRRFVQFRFRARTLLRGEGSSLARCGSVALDGRETNAEGLGDLDGGHAPFSGLDYLLSQVQRVGVHKRIVSYCPTTLQGALGAGYPDHSGSAQSERHAGSFYPWSPSRLPPPATVTKSGMVPR